MNYKQYFLAISLIAIVWIFQNCNNQKEKKVEVSITMENNDVDLFYAMLDKAKKNNREIDGDYLYENYFSKGSEALKFLFERAKKYAKEKNKTPEESYQEQFKPYLKFLEINREEIIKNKNLFTQTTLDKIAKKLSTFLNEDFKSTFYFIIGPGNMGGTAFKDGVIIDISMMKNENFDYSAHPYPQIINYLPNKEGALFLFVHEIMHQLQAMFKEKDSITKKTINYIGDFILEEGAGHFFSKILLEEKDLPMRFYLDQQEYYKNNPHLMNALLEDRNISVESKELKKWFFNMLEVKDEPADMGYYLGSVIAEDYYNRAEDKKKAFNEIVKYWEYKDKIINHFIENNR